MGLSLRKKPRLGSKRMVRNPQVVVTSSMGDAVALEDGMNRIQRGRFKRPKLWRIHREREFGRERVERIHCGFCGCGGDGLPSGSRRVDSISTSAALLSELSSATSTGDRPLAVGAAHGIGKDAIGLNVDGVSFDEPRVAIEARAFVPPAFLRHGIDLHGDGVDAVAELGEGRDVDVRRGVAAEVAIRENAVDPNGGVRRDAVEVAIRDVLPWSAGSSLK